MARITFTCVRIDTRGWITFWYDADGLFTDHDVQVFGTLEKGITDAGF